MSLKRHQIGVSRHGRAAQPLNLQEEDEAKVLVLLTTPERAKDLARVCPGYGGRLVVELGWSLERLGIGYGISLNPGGPVGIDLDARDLGQISSISRPNQDTAGTAAPDPI